VCVRELVQNEEWGRSGRQPGSSRLSTNTRRTELSKCSTGCSKNKPPLYRI